MFFKKKKTKWRWRQRLKRYSYKSRNSKDCQEPSIKDCWEPPSQFSSVTQSCPTLCYPMDCSTPGFPVHHQLPEFTQTHVHRVSNAIQPSHPLSSPSPPAFNLSQHQGLSQWVSSLHQMARALEFQLLSSPGIFLFSQTLVITVEERSNLGNY